MLSPDQVKNKLRALLIEGSDQVFAAAKVHIPASSKKMKALILLEGRHQDLLRQVQNGVISTEGQSLETNRIREQLLFWIDDLEEKDLESKPVPAKKRQLNLVLLLPAIFLMLALLWFVWSRQWSGPGEKQLTMDPDTVSTPVVGLTDSMDVVQQDSTREKSVEDTGSIGQIVESIQQAPPPPKMVEIHISVSALWKDSDILVDGQMVEPVKRVANYIRLALSVGDHKIQLRSVAGECEDNVRVREEEQVIPFVCD